MKLGIIGIILFVILGSCQEKPGTGSASVDLEVNPDSATIGDIVSLTLHIRDPQERNVTLLDGIAGGSLELRKTDHFRDRSGSQTYLMELVFWDTGKFVLPPVSLGLSHADGDTTVIFTNQAEVFIKSVLPADQNDMRPIKGPVPLKWKITIRTLLILILVLLVSLAAWLIWKKRQKQLDKNDTGFSPRETKDPVEYALERLVELEKDPAINVRDGYFRLTHIVRELIEGLFFVRTLEMTTGEIRENRHLLERISDREFKDLIDVLSRADGVKFAGHEPDLIHWDRDKRFIGSLISGFRKRNVDEH